MMSHTIVVVNDEPELLGLLQVTLEGEGYHVLTMDHPEMVAGAIAGQQPCLFLIDVLLPGISGITLAERLHAGADSATPKVAISASEVTLQHAMRSGRFAGTLSKPFDLKSLLGCVTQHVTTCSRHVSEGRGAYAQATGS